MRKFILFLLLLCFCAPVFAEEEDFYTLNDKPIFYQEMISQPKTILFVWATWCPSCRNQLKWLAQEQELFNNINIWYISSGESKSTLERFANSQKLDQRIRERIIVDTNNIIAEKFSISAIPTFILFKNSEPTYRAYSLNEKTLKKFFSEE